MICRQKKQIQLNSRKGFSTVRLSIQKLALQTDAPLMSSCSQLPKEPMQMEFNVLMRWDIVFLEKQSTISARQTRCPTRSLSRDRMAFYRSSAEKQSQVYYR